MNWRRLALLFLFCLVAPVHAGFFDRDSCDEIPIDQRVAEGTFCLQRTTAGGRGAGVTYIWDGTNWRQDANIPRVTVANLPTSPKTGDVVVVTDALSSTVCGPGGGTSNNSCQWNGSAWVIIGGGGGGGAGTPGGLDTQVQYNASGAFGGDSGLTYNAATDTLTVAGNVSVAGQSVCRADGTNCPGAGSFQPLDADLTTISALTGTGLLAHTGIGAWAERQITGAAGNIAITNPAGIAGNVIVDLGATAVQTDQSNTYTTGDQNMAAASSWTMPIQPGATPSANGRCAYDSTINRIKCYMGATVFTMATTAEMQPFNTNLSALAGLSGVAATIPYFTAAGAMDLAIVDLCIDSGGQHTNVPSIAAGSLRFTCGTTGGGSISGLTTGNIPKAASPTSLTPSIMSEAAGVVTIAGGFVVGTGSKVGLNTAALTIDRTWTVQDAAGTILPGAAAGTFTNGNILKANVAAGIVTIVDGGAAGTGTMTASSADGAQTNKTINAEDTGNLITIPFYVTFEAAGCNNATASETMDLPTANAPTAICTGTTTTVGSLGFPDASTTTATRHWRLAADWTGAIDVDLIWFANAASTNSVRWGVALGCVADGEAVSTGPTYNTQSLATTANTATANQRRTTSFTSVAVTNCAAGESIWLQVQRIGADGADTLAATANLLEVGVKMRRAM